MSALGTIEYESAKALRVGKFNMGLTTTTLVWRIGETLVDTGPPNQWEPVRRFVEEEKIKRVVLTHHHEDHAGNAARIHAELNIPVFAPEKAAAHIRNGHPLKPYQKIVWGRSTPFEPKIISAPLDAGNGFSLTPIPAPGHSGDLTCFLEPQKGWLFSGDLYIADRPIYFRADENFSEMVETLGRMKELDFKTLFCAHRGVVEDGPKALARKHDYLLELQEKAKALHSRGDSTRQITRRLLGKEDFTGMVTGFHFCKRNLINACLSAI